MTQFLHHHLLSVLPEPLQCVMGPFAFQLQGRVLHSAFTLVVRQGGHQRDGSGALVAIQTCPTGSPQRPRMLSSGLPSLNPSYHHRGEMGGWGNGQACPMIDGRWRSSMVAWWETTSPELDRVSVMAGGQPVAFPSISSSFIEFTPESWCFASQGQGRWCCVG